MCALSAGHPIIKKALEQMGITTVVVPPHPLLPKAVASHPDMLLHHMGGKRLAVSGYSQELCDKLEAQGFDLTRCRSPESGTYPGDIGLNALRMGRLCFCKFGSLDEEVSAKYIEMGIEMLPVAQGYARCSCCPVDSFSLITADPSICSTAAAAGLEVLRIRPGHVFIEEYSYGFIGGASGLIARDLLAFSGDIRSHPDYEEIRRFCGERGVELLSLTEGPLVDIGGIVPLMEDSDRQPCISVGNHVK